MSTVKKEVLGYIREIPDSSLKVLIPLLSAFVNETLIIETDLTEEEKEIIRAGREEYKKGNFVLLEDVLLGYE